MNERGLARVSGKPLHRQSLTLPKVFSTLLLLAVLAVLVGSDHKPTEL